MVRVKLNEKFTSVNLEEVISKFWNKSFEDKTIEFDLSKLEWIATEQMTFLIGWVNNLSTAERSVSILLPSLKDIDPEGHVFDRRQNCFNYIINDWRLFEIVNKKVQIFSGDILSTSKRQKDIPFYEVSTIKYYADTFDSDFYELYETKFGPFINYINKQIKENTLLNYFDNHFLHYSIIKEFFSNSCQHAYRNPINSKCYFALHFNSKIEKLYGRVLKEKLNERYSERPDEELYFFKMKGNEYINTSFIEITFLDFGDGIVKTLREKYLNENIDNYKDLLSHNHLKQNEDSRILEYAFLLFTSKYELGKDFEMHDYIPRGLFIIKDIVKRYEGMIVARSRKGKVVFNFRSQSKDQEVLFRKNDQLVTNDEEFPGTSITIILPAKAKSKATNIEPVATNLQLSDPKTHVINLLDFIIRVSCKAQVSEETNESKKKLRFYEEFFRKISSELLSLRSNNGDLILFDFASIEKENQDIYQKFIYFLAYCPLVSEMTNVCLFNVLDKGINHSLLIGEKERIKSKGFFIKPIPCIHPDMSISWIGISDAGLERRLSEVWQENYSKNETFTDINHLEGNVLRILFEENGKTTFDIKIQSYFIITELIYNYHQTFIKKELSDDRLEFPELKNEEHNYNIVLKTWRDQHGKERACLTANGKYQSEFLTFIEKLYIREYRRLISLYLLYNLFFDKSVELDLIKGSTKILTVTLSSQLLGKEFVSVMNELKVFNNHIELIPLSNYYDFNTEDPFDEIKSNDKVIVVNDVISTGNLSRKLIESVSKKNADILALLTIVDSRTTDDKRLQINSNIISLVDRPIEKFSKNPFDTTPIWINPILNAPTTMSRDKSNFESILKNPQEFINYFDNDDLFKIGHFQINTRYITYYLQTDLFFKTEQKNNFPIISQILEALKHRISKEKVISLENDLNEVRRIHKGYLSQYEQMKPEVLKEDIQNTTIIKSFDELEKLLSLQLVKNKQYSIFEEPTNQFIDFIFYPFLSSVSAIEKNLRPISLSLRGNYPVEIYPMPRIMTPKGWRFSFPPKFLNFHTKDKTGLILDDGSVTGDTIIQMIDSLSFLELNEIFVLSIFGRLEDFQREFLSRIRQIKVKDKNKGYKIIPVSVFFGTHFHIPVYSKRSHPAYFELKEMDEIDSLYRKDDSQMPNHLCSYITKHRSELSKTVNPQYSDSQVQFIPKEVQRRLMFIIRDLIGNFDSYRLFKEDEFDFTNNPSSNRILKSLKEILKDNQGKIALIGVLILEPNLVLTVKRIYPEILDDDDEPDNLKRFVLNELISQKTFNEIEGLQFYMKGLYNIDFTLLYNFDILLKLLDKIEQLGSNGEYLYDNIGYYFSTILFKTNNFFNETSFFNAKLIIQKLYLYINDAGLHGKKYSSLIKELYNESLINIDDFPSSKNVNLIFRIQHYYQRQVSNHDGKVYSSHPNFYTAFESIINRLGVYKETYPSEDEKNELVEDIVDLIEKTNRRLFNDLVPVLDFLEPFYMNYDFGIDIPLHKKLLHQLNNLRKSISNREQFKTTVLSNKNIPILLKWTERFNETFFLLKSQLPDFFIKNRTNLLQLIKNTIKEHELKRAKCKIDLQIPDDIFLKIHPYLLRLIFYELIENKYKYAEDSDASILYKEIDSTLIITYQQSKPFEENKNENGLITIRNIIKRYGGNPSTRSHPKYEFELTFSKEIKTLPI